MVALAAGTLARAAANRLRRSARRSGTRPRWRRARCGRRARRPEILSVRSRPICPAAAGPGSRPPRRCRRARRARRRATSRGLPVAKTTGRSCGRLLHCPGGWRVRGPSGSRPAEWQNRSRPPRRRSVRDAPAFRTCPAGSPPAEIRGGRPAQIGRILPRAEHQRIDQQRTDVVHQQGDDGLVGVEAATQQARRKPHSAPPTCRRAAWPAEGLPPVRRERPARRRCQKSRRHKAGRRRRPTPARAAPAGWWRARTTRSARSSPAFPTANRYRRPRTSPCRSWSSAAACRSR